MQFPRPARNTPELNMTPLIDVVFLLLIFFMVATSFTRESQISIDLPKASTTQTSLPENRIEVNVTSQGTYFINGKAVADNQITSLMDLMEAYANGDRNRLILISADRAASHESVVKVMDAAGKLGFHQLQISTSF